MQGRNRPLFVRVVLVAVLVAIAGPRSVDAQPTGKLPPIYDGAGLEEQLGDTVPLDVVLRDENGVERTLGSLIPDDRPVLRGVDLVIEPGETLALVGAEAQYSVGGHRIQTLFLEGVRADLVAQADPPPLLCEVDEDPSTSRLEMTKALAKLFSAVAA